MPFATEAQDVVYYGYLAYILVVLIGSVIVHEVMHGWVALKFGDTTAQKAGRLTLNPIKHLDPIGSFLLPAMMLFLGLPGIGWAKPVPINPGEFSSYRKGLFWVSIAGLGTNLLIGAVMGLSLRLIVALPMDDLAKGIISMAIVPWVWINLLLGVFNLLPIPPLDGCKVFGSLIGLPAKLQFSLDKFGLFILLAFVFLVPPEMLQGLIYVVATLFYWLTGMSVF